MLVGSNSSQKYLVGNIILGRQAFDLGDVTSCCERREGKVYGRRVKVVKAPGWLRGYDLSSTPELFTMEAILSVTTEVHCFILVVSTNFLFKRVNERATKEHLLYFYGYKVWDHTIVVFNHRGYMNYETIEDYISREGAPLQSLLAACGNRYHVLCDDGTDNNKTVKELFEKIDAMVAKSGVYTYDSTLLQNVQSQRTEVDRKAKELYLKSRQQRQRLRKLLTGQLSFFDV